MRSDYRPKPRPIKSSPILYGPTMRPDPAPQEPECSGCGRAEEPRPSGIRPIKLDRHGVCEACRCHQAEAFAASMAPWKG